MAPRKPAPNSPARARLLEAAAKARFGLKELSGMLGRNHSYLQQYVHKGSPRELPQDAREDLSKILDVPANDLRDGPGGKPSRKMTLPVIQAKRTGAPSELPAMRLIREGQNAGAAAEFAPSDMLAGVSDQAIAIALTRSHGMLQPRHILICDPIEAARLGDLVASVVDAEVKAVGILVPRGIDGTVAVMDGQAPDHPVKPDAVWRVVAVRTA